jgi:hypothetical protein
MSEKRQGGRRNRKPYGSGATSRRGYGTRHQTVRKNLAPRVAAGVVNCARCGFKILPGEPWDLGHVDGDKSRYRGPEHEDCNRNTNGKQPNRRQSRRW